jgi:hypothetical protein
MFKKIRSKKDGRHMKRSWACRTPDIRAADPIYSADDERVLQFMAAEFLRQGMETAKIVAVAGHAQVLEDGPEMGTPETEQEEHGDVLEGIYTPDMLDKRKSSLGQSTDVRGTG